MTAKYSGFVLYVHNLGKFDIAFILSTLVNANTDNRYKLNILPRYNVILCLTIAKSNNYKVSIKLVDSYNILT